MKRAAIVIAMLSIFFLLAGCRTTTSNLTDGKKIDDTSTKTDATMSTNKSDGTSETSGPADMPRSLKEMQSFYANALKKMDEMAVSEAINQYVAVLAIKNQFNTPSPEILELAKKAETALTKIEAGLLFQAGAEWLDANSNQITGSTFTVGKADALNPKVTIWYNVGGSRIALSAAPVVFEFTKGKGLLTSFLTTNEYGEASVPLAKIDNPSQETVVRAMVVYTVRGFTYPFSQTHLDFVYLPPSKRATILVYERGPDYVAEDPYIFNTVYNSFKKLEFDFIPFNGRLLGNDFMNVFGGDLKAIKGLTIEQNVPYLVVVLNDCYSIRKISETANIYLGEAKSTLRIIRVLDGKILFEAVGFADKSHNTHGQGSSQDKTLRDVITRSSSELEKDLAKKVKEINKALGLE